MDYVVFVVFFAGLAAIILIEHHLQLDGVQIDSGTEFALQYFKDNWKSAMAGVLVWFRSGE